VFDSLRLSPSGISGRAVIDVLLINPHFVRRRAGGIIPPIGLCYLAASLEQSGAIVSILDLAAEFPEFDPATREQPLNFLRSFLKLRDIRKPLLVGVGPLVTATLQSVRDIVLTCREETACVVVVGGPLCSVPGVSEIIQTFLVADLHVVGDGEFPMVRVWESFRRDATPSGPGIALPGSTPTPPWRQPNLDDLPLPARHLLTSTSYRPSARREFVTAGPVTAAFLSRGCPYSCTFCAAPLSSGKVVRRLSPYRISQELRACKESGFRSLIFYDDCLFIKSPKLDQRVLEFCEAVARSAADVSFQLELRCDAVLALSETALTALINIGCEQINMGIEKGHVRNLEKIRKRLTPDIARDACSRLDSAGVRSAGTFILGGHGETLEDVLETIHFAVTLPLTFAHFNPLALYPGTQLFTETYGDLPADSWLRFCLDPDLAPRGDILWRSNDLPLPLILERIAEAYRLFYAEHRLVKVLLANREPAARNMITAAYGLLREDRALSWHLDEKASP
jgi:radical SAM superfamily enzyme YgiQ (UPF0313 family)